MPRYIAASLPGIWYQRECVHFRFKRQHTVRAPSFAHSVREGWETTEVKVSRNPPIREPAIAPTCEEKKSRTTFAGYFSVSCTMNPCSNHARPAQKVTLPSTPLPLPPRTPINIS